MLNECHSLLKGLASQCKAQEKYKERLDSGVTWLKWLPTGMESKTRLAPKSNKVNSHKLTLNWNTSLYYRVVWKWRQSAFHANNHAIGGGSNGIIIHLCLNPGFGLQLLSINFVGFGSQHGLRFHTSRQSFEPSYTQIQALPVFFLSFALASQPFRKAIWFGNSDSFFQVYSLWLCLDAFVSDWNESGDVGKSRNSICPSRVREIMGELKQPEMQWQWWIKPEGPQTMCYKWKPRFRQKRES